MANFMVEVDVPSDKRNEAIKRFTEGSALQIPDGARLAGPRWQKVASLGAWMVVETDNPSVLYDWLLSWNDILDVKVTPVISDEDAGALFQKHGLSA